MRKAIIGAGGFAREVLSYIQETEHLGYQILMFVDEEYYNGQDDILPLSKFDPKKYEVVIAIGNPKDRFDMVQKLPKNTKYFTYIHPTAQILNNNIQIGEGSIICPGVIMTTNIKLGKHSHLNLLTTIGHDCEIDSYFTTAPGVKISGNCKIYSIIYVGTNASIREKLSIHSLVTIGMNAAVVKDINEPGIYVGIPAKKLN